MSAKQVKNEAKEQKDQLLDMFLGILGGRLLGSKLTGER